MTVLIENEENGLYMNAASLWASKEEAYDFHTPALAIELCMMRRLRNVRIIVDLGDPADDFSLIVCGADQGVAGTADSLNNRDRRSNLGKAGIGKKPSVRVRARRRGVTNRQNLGERSESKRDVASDGSDT